MVKVASASGDDMGKITGVLVQDLSYAKLKVKDVLDLINNALYVISNIDKAIKGNKLNKKEAEQKLKVLENRFAGILDKLNKNYIKTGSVSDKFRLVNGVAAIFNAIEKIRKNLDDLKEIKNETGDLKNLLEEWQTILKNA